MAQYVGCILYDPVPDEALRAVVGDGVHSSCLRGLDGEGVAMADERAECSGSLLDECGPTPGDLLHAVHRAAEQRGIG